MTQLEREALAVIREAGPISKRQATAILKRRKQDVARAVSALERAGEVRSTADGWIAAGTTREPALRRRRAGLSIYFRELELAEAVARVLERADDDELEPAIAAVVNAIERRRRRDSAGAGS